MKTLYIILIAVVVIVGGILLLKYPTIPEKNTLGSISGNPSLGSNSTLTATTTAKIWLNSNNNAQFISISNVGMYDAYISATTTSLTANNGLWLKASSTIIFSGDSLYRGAWYGIANGTTTISILKI